MALDAKTSRSEYVTTFVAPVVSPRVRIVKVVVVLRLIYQQMGAPCRGIGRQGVLIRTAVVICVRSQAYRRTLSESDAGMEVDFVP